MKIITLLFTILLYHKGFSQGSDFIVIKKNNKTVKTFFAGSHIEFETNSGYYGGQISGIRKDTLYLLQFDIRQIPTKLGVYVWDTVAIYRLQFNYKDILAVGGQKQKGFNLGASGGSLFGGGLLLTTVGLGTWLFTKPGTQYYASPYLVGGAAILAGAGYVLLRSNSGNYTIGKNYSIEYISVRK